MTTLTTTPLSAFPGARPAQPRAARIFGLELRNELLMLVRSTGFTLPAIGFPLMFYALFGLALPFPGIAGTPMTQYLLATYGVFGVLGVSIFSLGANVAIERGRGWTTARRALPASTRLHLAARILVAALFGCTIALGLMILGAAFGGVRLETWQWAALLAILAASAIPFGALGLALGQVLSSDSAPGMVNLIYLPMSFLSGLWIPVTLLPAPLRAFAEWLPPYHASQLALGVLDAARAASPWPSVLYLAVLTAVAFSFATVAARRAGGTRG